MLSEYLLEIYYHARLEYEAKPYAGRVIYVKSEKRPPDHLEKWAGLIGEGFECHEVPGDHMDAITRPYAHIWAERLTGWLDAGCRGT